MLTGKMVEDDSEESHSDTQVVPLYTDAEVTHPEYREEGSIPGAPEAEGVSRGSFVNETLREYFEKYSRMSWLDFLCDTEGYQLFKKLKGNGLLE